MARFGILVLLSIPLVGAYAIFAIGIVVIYRASRVLNLAHGAIAMAPAYIVYSLSRMGIPAPIAALLGIAAGALLGLAVERAFVRPFAHRGVTAQTVGTVAALAVIVSVVAKVWGTTVLPAVNIFPELEFNVGRSVLTLGQLGLFAVMLAVSGGLFFLLQFTDVGLAMRGAAENPRAARLMGVSADRMTSLAWIIGGASAGLAGILLGALINLHPYILSLQALPAFVAALIGGLGSLGGALVGAGLVGVVLGLVPAVPLLDQLDGSPQLLLGVIAIIAMALRGQRFAGAGSA